TATFLTAPAILTAAGLFLGLAPAELDELLGSYAGTDPSSYHLALWHGSGKLEILPLALSALVTLLGTVAFFARARFRRAQLGWLPLGNADRAYQATIRG